MGNAAIVSEGIKCSHVLELHDRTLNRTEVTQLSNAVLLYKEELLQIKLVHLHLTPPIFESIVIENLPDLRKLEILDVSQNEEVGVEGVRLLGDKLKLMTSCSVLTPQELAQFSPTELIENMKKSWHLLTLHLNGIGLGNVGFSVLCEALMVNNTVSNLTIRENQILNLKPLANVLKENRRIKLLDLSFNNFGNKGLKSLIYAILLVKEPDEDDDLEDEERKDESKEDGGLLLLDEDSISSHKHQSTVNCLKIKECGIKNLELIGDMLEYHQFQVLDFSENYFSNEEMEELKENGDDQNTMRLEEEVIEKLSRSPSFDPKCFLSDLDGIDMGPYAHHLGLIAPEWKDCTNKEILTFLRNSQRNQEQQEKEDQEIMNQIIREREEEPNTNDIGEGDGGGGGKEEEDDEDEMEEVV